MELGRGTEQNYFDLQKAPPFFLISFLPGAADCSQILVDSKEIQKTKKQVGTDFNAWIFHIFCLVCA